MTDNPLLSSVVKQGRTLTVFSALIIFLHFTEPEYKGAHIPFLNIELGKPEWIPVAIWIAFGYFIWRWIQYIFQERPNSVLELWRSIYAHSMEKYRTQLRQYAFDKYKWKEQSPVIFQGWLRTSFYVYTSINDEEGVVYLSKGHLDSEKKKHGPVETPLKYSIGPALIATLEVLVLRPNLWEEYLPAILAITAIWIHVFC